MTPPAGIIFDMDGLLFDTEALYCQVNLRLAPAYDLDGYDKEYYFQYLGVSDKELHHAYFNDFPHVPAEKIQAFIEQVDQEIERMFLQGKVPLKDGAKELLAYLKTVNIPAVIASSNKRHLIEILIETADIVDCFQGIVSVDDVKRAKPDPEIVNKAVELLAVPASDCLMLEDSYNGVRAAYAAGVPVIMVPDILPPTAEMHEKAQLIASDLRQVQALLQK